MLFGFDADHFRMVVVITASTQSDFTNLAAQGTGNTEVIEPSSSGTRAAEED